MKILNKNTLTLQDYYLNNKPYPHIVLRDIFDNELLDDVVDNIKRINKEGGGKIWYKLCTTGNDFSKFGKSAVALTNYLISPDWVKFISFLTGIENLKPDPDWHGAGINFEPRGSHLELHTDFNVHRTAKHLGWRRVNVLLFLSKDWKDEWGGQNELWNKDLSKCEASTNPEFNTLVVFSTSDNSWHGFPPVTCPEDRARKVISCYYYSEDPGPHSRAQTHTNYQGWGKDRDFEDRKGTGYKSLD